MLIKAAVDADAFASKHSTAKAIVRREGCSSSARAVKLGACISAGQADAWLGSAVHLLAGKISISNQHQHSTQIGGGACSS